MSKSAPRLGKGLSAIISSREKRSHNVIPQGPSEVLRSETATKPASTEQRIIEAPIEKITPNPQQPRTAFDPEALAELTRSIRASGVLQPILVRKTDDEQFELVAGERRWRAAKDAGLTTIPAIVRDFSQTQSFEAALVENLQREDLGPLERAEAYQQYIKAFGVSAEQLARRLGQSRANIVNYQRLLNLSPEIRALVANGELSMGQARAIAGIADAQRQLAVAKLAIRRNLSVRQVEALAREPVEGGSTHAPAAAENKHLSDVAVALSKAIGVPVRMHAGRKKNSGRIVIRYNSLEEFDRVAERLGAREFLE